MLQNQEIETWGRKKTERGKYLGNTTNKSYRTETQGSYSDNTPKHKHQAQKRPLPTHSLLSFQNTSNKNKFMKLSKSKTK